ncbi:UDP-2,3-diacylglucosamine diphosphatase [Pollutimonas harenae]|uniref:UDP-2,3-diacylglucosamine diphosphatase n=1 Tax=Pollutimonas harenae TaxID=657015 RepID=A0A853GSE7_9BURK|nr:UDP-2,3-diacylglucosamine diphosphatase [Pollutimonas harenae]NYT86028.1 UDP-2,3-diacylglucosamine diphosphatase [Pollutimonas harenae]TEA71076.1 UDP-2,3-diacylglucosamine diphosphatase [Pollutimonas harenae]
MIQAHDTSKTYRTIWISDLHLGTPGCQADALLDFLKQHESETLYLVGDIIDGWQLKKRWYWPQSHNDIVQKILRKARKGTRVVYVPGNHDSFARQYTGEQFGGIEVHLEAEHTTLKGQCLLITHGDLFDGVIQYAPWLAYLGDRLYSLVLAGNVWFNRARARMGLGYWSLSQYLKHKVKDAVSFITAFEDALIKEAKRRGFDGVVCGHIHKAQMREVDGVLYCNDGDWVESLTALVEHVDGRLEIISWLPERSPKPRKSRGKESSPLVATPIMPQAVTQTVETETAEGVTQN